MLTLDLNGKTTRVDAEPDTPLLWVLRDTLRLTKNRGQTTVSNATQE